MRNKIGLAENGIISTKNKVKLIPYYFIFDISGLTL